MGVFSNLWGGMSEAPADGRTYGRKNHVWVVLAAIGRWVLDTGTDTSISAIWDDTKYWDDTKTWEEN